MRFFFLVYFIFLNACSHPQLKKPTGLTQLDFLKSQRLRKQELKNFSAKISLNLQSKKENISGSGRVLVSEDRFQLEIRDPLGREQYVLTYVDKKLEAYYPSQKVVFIDSLKGKEYLKKTFGFEQDFLDFEGLWLGILPEESSGGKFEKWEWNASQGVYEGSLRFKEGVLTCFIDGESKALTQLLWENTRMSVLINLMDFEPFSGLLFAHSVKFKNIKNNSQVEVEWDELKKNALRPEDGIFKVVYPVGVEKRVLN